MTTDAAPTETPTPEVTTPEATTPETTQAEAQPTLLDAPVETPDGEAPGGETPEGETPEPETPKGPRSLEEIEAAYEANEPLTRAEIDQLASDRYERQQRDEQSRQQREALQNFGPNLVQRLAQQAQEIATRPLDPQTKAEVLTNSLWQTFQQEQQNLAPALTEPFRQSMANQAYQAMVDAGMSPKDANKALQSMPFDGAVKAVVDTVKKNLSKDVIKREDMLKPETVKKSHPEIFKAWDRYWNEQHPERGGLARPGGGSPAGGRITMEWIDKATPQQIMALTPEQKAEMNRVLGKR